MEKLIREEAERDRQRFWESVKGKMADQSDHDILIQVQTICLDLRQRLFGNGQPGVIKIIEDRVLALEELKIKSDLSTLRANGRTIVLVAISVAVLAAVLEHLPHFLEALAKIL